MLVNRFHQPLSRRGLTLMEIVVGMAVASVIGLISAGLFKAGMKTYNYSFRQTSVLSTARYALTGTGKVPGIIWAGQNAASVTAISSATLGLVPYGVSTTTFLVSSGSLYQTQGATRTLQALSITTAAFSYYNLDSAGHIMVSTSAASATFVTVQLTLAGKGSADREYNSLAGAQLRNHK